MTMKGFVLFLFLVLILDCSQKKQVQNLEKPINQIIAQSSVNSNLLGAWKDVENANAEQIVFSSESGTNSFLSYLHDRLSSTGVWYTSGNQLVIIGAGNTITNWFTNVSTSGNILQFENEFGMTEKYRKIKGN